MKVGEKIAKTRLIKMMLGKSQVMWSKEDKCFKPIALTTRYDNNQITITEIRESYPYQIIRGSSETQLVKLIYTVKKEELMQGAILPVGWND